MTMKLMPDLCDEDCPGCSQGLRSLIVMDGDNPRRMTTEEAPCPTAALILGVMELRESQLQKTKEVSEVIDS